MDNVATLRQDKLIRNLANERVLAPADRDRLIAKLDAGAITKLAARTEVIPWLLKRPHNESPETTLAERAKRDDQPITDRASAEAYVAQVTRTSPRPERDLVADPLPTHGVFRFEEHIYIVVPSRRNHGKHYAMKMVTSPDRLTSSGEVVNFDYVRAPGVIWQLREEHRLPAEAVESLMIEHRVCIYPNCGRTLRAAKSVALGAGKIHARQLGLI